MSEPLAIDHRVGKSEDGKFYLQVKIPGVIDENYSYGPFDTREKAKEHYFEIESKLKEQLIG